MNYKQLITWQLRTWRRHIRRGALRLLQLRVLHSRTRDREADWGGVRQVRDAILKRCGVADMRIETTPERGRPDHLRSLAGRIRSIRNSNA
jgi:hypothetical protein